MICIFVVLIALAAQMLGKSEKKKIKRIRRIIRFNWANTNYRVACVMLVNLKLAHLHQNQIADLLFSCIFVFQDANRYDQ